MKKEKKIVIIMMIGISVLFSLLTVKNYAANEMNDGNTTNVTEETENNTAQQFNSTQESSNTTNTSNSTNEATTVKSSNANLSDLGITPHDFKGFKYGTTYYEISVPEDTETVEVYAKTQDKNAQVTGTGKKNLEKGENKAEVTVTAEDGTEKTYTINIIREIQQGQESETGTEAEAVNIEDGNGLLELKIGDLTLTPEFATDVYEYTVKYIGEETKLNIETKATSADYIVEVTGNDNLQEGENIITILVSEEDGENVATYQITLNKSLVDYEAVAREEEKKQKILIGSIIAVVIVTIIVVIIIKRKKNKKLENEFSEDFSYGNIKNEQYEEELPRALIEKSKRKKVSHEFEEDDIEKMPREELKEEFLKNYLNNNVEDYGTTKVSNNKRSKGKRYK